VKTKLRVTVILLIFITVGLLWLKTEDKIAGVMLLKYSVSDDGRELSFKVGIASSIGYTRTLKTKDVGNKKYITFYSTYGFNSNIGAKKDYQINLDPTCEEIYFYSGSGEYKLVLLKNSDTNEWEKPEY
jgi:hypothetical protein